MATKTTNEKTEAIKTKLVDRVHKEMDAIVTALIEKAKMGDTVALKEILERALGRVREDFSIQARIDNNITISDARLDQIALIRARRLSADLATVDGEAKLVAGQLPPSGN